MALSLRADGSWAGTLAANGRSVEVVGGSGAGPQAVVGELAQLWIAAGEAVAG